MRILAIVILLVASLTGQNVPVGSSGQPSAADKGQTNAKPMAPPKAKSPTYHVAGDAKMWLENAEVLTAEALQDGRSHMDASRLALLEARLAVRWQTTDPAKAQKWLESAVEKVTRAPMNEPVNDAVRRLFAALDVAQCATVFDQQLTDRTLNSAIDQIGETAKSATKEEKARLSVLMHRLSTFTLTGGKNPSAERDAKIARALMRIGTPETFNAILQPMEAVYFRDARLGDSLLSEMLDRVEQKQLPLQAMWSMTNILFPNESVPDPPKVDEGLRTRYLAIVYNAAIKTQARDTDSESCKSITPYSYLANRYPQDQQAQLRLVIEGCKSHLDGDYKKEADEGLKGLTTSDDYLKAADESSDADLRAEYKSNAAGLLMNSNPEKALDILDGMTAEEKKSPQFDSKTRDWIETNIAMRALKTKEYAKLQQVIDRSSNPAATALHVAALAGSRGEEAYAMTLLPLITKLLERESKEEPPNFYPELLSVFAKLSRPEAPAVLQAALKHLDAQEEVLPTDPPHKRKEGEIRYMSFWADLRPAPFPDLLDVIDQRIMRAQIEQLKYPGERASMRLWLLRGELNAYEDAMKAEKPAKKSAETKAVPAPSGGREPRQ